MIVVADSRQSWCSSAESDNRTFILTLTLTLPMIFNFPVSLRSDGDPREIGKGVECRGEIAAFHGLCFIAETTYWG